MSERRSVGARLMMSTFILTRRFTRLRRNITLVGQSAGAHLGSMVLLTKAAAAFRSESLKMVNRFSFATVEEGVDFDLAVDQGLTDVEELRDGSPTSRSTTPEFERVRGFTEVKQETWKPTDLRGFIPISGPYDLVELCDHFQKRGLDRRILDWIFQKVRSAREERTRRDDEYDDNSMIIPFSNTRSLLASLARSASKSTPPQSSPKTSPNPS